MSKLVRNEPTSCVLLCLCASQNTFTIPDFEISRKVTAFEDLESGYAPNFQDFRGATRMIDLTF